MHDFPFIAGLEPLVFGHFSVLDRDYVRDLWRELYPEICQAIARSNAVHFVLFEPETGQLASTKLFETREEARDAARERGLPGCVIGTLVAGRIESFPHAP